MKKPSLLSTTFNAYKIGRVLGEGGAGFVYAATDESGEAVAIKVLNPKNVTKDRLKRFKNEYTFCSSTEHPNVVRVIDRGLYDGEVAFFVMPEYDDSIEKLVGDLSSKEKIQLFTAILDGVEAAHLKDVIHRDLKPKNVLYRNRLSEIVVSDFGIARFDDESLFTEVKTKQTDRLANFQYRAPEQLVQGAKVGPGTDIYALGLMLNEFFTGQIPAGTRYQTIGDVDEEFGYLDSIVEDMLRQNINDRFGSIDALKREISKQSAEYVSRQKIREIDKKVVKFEEPDDPLLADPIRVVGGNWDGKRLIIEFNQNVTPEWQNALVDAPGVSYLTGMGPLQYSFRGNKATIACDANYTQELVDMFKQWLPKANSLYEQRVRQALIKGEQRLQHELEVEKRAEQERLDVNAKLTF